MACRLVASLASWSLPPLLTLPLPCFPWRVVVSLWRAASGERRARRIGTEIRGRPTERLQGGEAQWTTAERHAAPEIHERATTDSSVQVLPDGNPLR